MGGDDQPRRVSLAIDDAPFPSHAGRGQLVDHRVVAPPGDEADVLALRLLRDRELERARDLAHRLLVEVADREERARELQSEYSGA